MSKHSAALISLFLFSILSNRAGADEVHYTANVSLTGLAVFAEGSTVYGRERITIPKGQTLTLKHDFLDSDSYFVVERYNAGHLETGKLHIPNRQLKAYFGDPSDGRNGNDGEYIQPTYTKGPTGGYIRMENNPNDLARTDIPRDGDSHWIPDYEIPYRTREGGARIVIKESKVIDFAYKLPHQWTLVDRICFAQPGMKERCGWVKGDAIRQAAVTQPTANFNANQEPASNLPCAPKSTIHNAGNLANAMVETLRLFQADKEKRDIISEKIGFCVIDPNVNPDSLNIERFDASNANIYDPLVLHTMQREFPPNIQKPPPLMVNLGLDKSGNPVRRPFTQDDYIAIDVLARTLYAEMRSCGTELGNSEYLKGTARIILNRAAAKNRTAEFIRGPQATNSSISKVMLSDTAFSCWNNAFEVAKKDLPNHKKNLKQGLCPRDASSTEESKNAWQQSLDVAMAAILDRGTFLDNTSELEGYYFYTSKKDRGPAWARLPTPHIDGKPLNNGKCMKFWKEAE